MLELDRHVSLHIQILLDDLYGRNELFDVYGITKYDWYLSMDLSIPECEDIDTIKRCVSSLKGQLTGTILSNSNEELIESGIIDLLQLKVGRMIHNGVPTGVEVVESMQHGGPFPSSSESQTTAVGLDAIYRFVRPICFQNYNHELLTDFLK